MHPNLSFAIVCIHIAIYLSGSYIGDNEVFSSYLLLDIALEM